MLHGPDLNLLKNPPFSKLALISTLHKSQLCTLSRYSLRYFSVCLSFAFECFQNRFEEQGSLAYDPLTGTFLTLQWRNIFLLREKVASTAASASSEADGDPLSLLLQYRYPRNDPINAKFNPFPGKLASF